MKFSSGFFLSKENAFELKIPKYFPQEELIEEWINGTKSGILVVGLKSTLFRNKLPVEYNTKPNRVCPQNYSSFKIKECFHTIKQTLPCDNLIAKTSDFMVYLKIQQEPLTIIYNETDKHLKQTIQTSSKNTPDRPTGLFSM